MPQQVTRMNNIIAFSCQKGFRPASITLTTTVSFQYSSYYWVGIYFEVSTTEVITMDYIYVLSHCVSESIK